MIRLKHVLGVIVVVAQIQAIPHAAAASVRLSQGVFSFDVNNGGSLGTFRVDDAGAAGLNRMDRSWWYRIGSSGPEKSIDRLSVVSTSSTGPNLQVQELRDASGLFSFRVTTFLTYSQRLGFIQQGISVSALGTDPLDFHLFMRDNTDLDQACLCNESAPDYDDIEWVDQKHMRQTSPRGARLDTRLTQGEAADGFRSTIGTRVIGSLHFDELGNLLRDANPTTLGSNTGLTPLTRPTLCELGIIFIPNNAKCFGRQWAWEWDFALDTDQSFRLTVQDRVATSRSVNEPASLCLIAASVLMGALSKKRGR